MTLEFSPCDTGGHREGSTSCSATKQFALSADIVDLIREYRGREHPESYLISVLHKVQERLGYLPAEALDEIAQQLQVPAATVSGVASFYHFFRLKPRGKHAISVCLGTACFVKGADRLLDAIRKELGIDLGETTKDAMFSLEGSRCLGVCALAPVITINDKVYGQVTPQQIPDLLDKAKQSEQVSDR